MSTTELLVFSGIAAFWGLIIFGALRGGSEKTIIQRAQAEGRHRIVDIDRKKFHAIRKTEVILRSKSGKGRAVLVSVGRERDPDMVNGQIEIFPRWIKIRSFTRNGLSDNERWVRAKDWSQEGKQDIEYHIPLK